MLQRDLVPLFNKSLLQHAGDRSCLILTPLQYRWMKALYGMILVK